jgi:hypothetical protein
METGTFLAAKIYAVVRSALPSHPKGTARKIDAFLFAYNLGKIPIATSIHVYQFVAAAKVEVMTPRMCCPGCQEQHRDTG